MDFSSKICFNSDPDKQVQQVIFSKKIKSKSTEYKQMDFPAKLCRNPDLNKQIYKSNLPSLDFHKTKVT